MTEQINWTRWDKAMYQAKLAQDNTVKAIVEALPPEQFDHANLLARFVGQPNALVDWLAERGIYRARVAHWNRSGYDFISEPMDGVAVPRLEHGHGGHSQAWVRVI